MKQYYVYLMMIGLLGFAACGEEDDAQNAPESYGIYTYTTFDRARIAFGNGFERDVTQTFELHGDVRKTAQIMMYIHLTCPSGGCDPWDRFANVNLIEPNSGERYELGRYITPYGLGTEQTERGLPVDVTDFKSLLEGEVTLQAHVDTWVAQGWELTVEFEYIEGPRDFEYTAIVPVFRYDRSSLSGVPYGKDHNFDLTKRVNIPATAQETTIRATISGWGHDTPGDRDGRRCAEWCFRTHEVKIDGITAIEHAMEPIGCGSNPIQPQPGNWQPDRAGWCPGMAVPIRRNTLNDTYAGRSFDLEYDFEDWVNDGTGDGAFYALSLFVVVRSTQPIEPPTVED